MRTHVDSAEFLISSARKLVNWLTSRQDVTLPVSPEDISSVIESRRNVKTVIAAALKSGVLVQRNSELFANCNIITPKSNIRRLNTADRNEVPLLLLSKQLSTTLFDAVSSLESTNIQNNTSQANLNIQNNSSAAPPNILKNSSQDLRISQLKKFLGNEIPRIFSKNFDDSSSRIRTETFPKGMSNVSDTLTNTNNSYLNLNNTNTKTRAGAHTRSNTSARTRKKSTAATRKSQIKESLKNQEFETQTKRMRSVITGIKINSTASSTAILESKAYGIALFFEEYLGVYKYNPTLKYLTGPVNSSSTNFKKWLTAAITAEELGVSYSTYVKAQFWWFNKHFARHPKVYELSGGRGVMPAQERVKAYLAAVADGTQKESANIVGPNVATVDTTSKQGKLRSSAVRASQSVRFANSERTLKSFMKNYNQTEEWVILKFGRGPTASQYFDLKWLKQHPTYIRLHAAGQI